MFTGIVEGVGALRSSDKRQGFTNWVVDFPEGALDGIEIGASVAIEGVCLTVTSINGRSASFQIIEETLHRSTLGNLRPGDPLNYERSLTYGKEVGGHLVSGHVMEVGKIIKRLDSRDENNGEATCSITIQTSEMVGKYIFEKGYVSIEGISLTIGNTHNNASFDLHIIPETLRRTTLGHKKEGSLVNIEIDSITKATVDTVMRMSDGV